MLLYNTSTEKQSIQAFGNWFTFAPGAYKAVNQDIGHFISTDKKQYGIVALPDAFVEDLGFKDTEEGKAILQEKILEGRLNRVNFIRGVMHNEEVSLRMDLEKANMKINPNVLANDNYVKLLKEYQGYKKADEDAQRERVEEIQKIKKDLGRE